MVTTEGRADHLEELRDWRDGGRIRDSVTSARHWAAESSVCVRRARLRWEIWTERVVCFTILLASPLCLPLRDKIAIC